MSLALLVKCSHIFHFPLSTISTLSQFSNPLVLAPGNPVHSRDPATGPRDLGP